MEPAVSIAVWSIAVPAVVTAVLTAIVTPIVVAVVQSRHKQLDAEIAADTRRVERDEEWKRADLLEARSVERAEEVARRAAEASALLVKTTVAVREKVNALDSKTDEIHALVNSSYTAALQATLEALQGKMIALMNSADFKRDQGIEADSALLAEIEATKLKIKELTFVIDERMKQDVLAKEEKARGILLGKRDKVEPGDQPLPVADERTARAAEKTAEATVVMAEAATRTVEVAEKAADKEADKGDK